MNEQQKQDNSFAEFEKQFKNDQWAKGVLIGGMVMYAGAVLFGFFRNLQLFAPTFAGVEYAQIGYFAVIILACNAFIMPLFIHKRASGAQFWAAIIFYVMEMTIYIMNATVEPRAALIAKGEADPFITWYYWNVAFVAPILIMVFWGTLFLLDPESQMSRAISEARGELVGRFASKAKIAAHTAQMNERVTAQAQGFVDGMADTILPTAQKPLLVQESKQEGARIAQQDAPAVNFPTPQQTAPRVGTDEGYMVYLNQDGLGITSWIGVHSTTAYPQEKIEAYTTENSKGFVATVNAPNQEVAKARARELYDRNFQSRQP